MNRTFASVLLATAMIASTGAAQAKGCMEGAAVGGVAGHVAGEHGTAGAVGHHEANKKDKRLNRQRQPARRAASKP